MGIEIKTRMPLGRRKGAIHMILHICRSIIHTALLLPTGGCMCSIFLWKCSPWWLRETMSPIQFHEPSTKLWLFDTLVMPTFVYIVEIWGPSLHRENNWTHLERSLISMIACTKMSKASEPQDIILKDVPAAPSVTTVLFWSVTKVLFWSVTSIQRIWNN